MGGDDNKRDDEGGAAAPGRRRPEHPDFASATPAGNSASRAKPQHLDVPHFNLSSSHREATDNAAFFAKNLSAMPHNRWASLGTSLILLTAVV
jgi:hypothetical protein